MGIPHKSHQWLRELWTAVGYRPISPRSKYPFCMPNWQQFPKDGTEFCRNSYSSYKYLCLFYFNGNVSGVNLASFHFMTPVCYLDIAFLSNVNV